MSRLRRAHFAAVLTPTGAHVLEYRRRRGHLDVVRYRSDASSHASIDTAAEALADLLEAEGARGGQLVLAVAGFGSCHNLLTLPPAAPELLEPIVLREMRRFYPDLFGGPEGGPCIAFVQAEGRSTADQPSMRDLLAAGVPREVMTTVREATALRGIRLDHLTIVPAAISRLFESYLGSEGTAALAIVTAEYATVGFFHQGGLRLFTEPPAYGRGDLAEPERVVADQVERGSLYLRQQFRGARLQTVHLAAEAEERLRIAELLGDRESVTVLPLGDGAAPGALLALGAALDAHDTHGLNLLPAELRPPSLAERWNRAAGVAAAALLLILTAIWALTGVRREAEGAALIRVQQEGLVPRTAALARMNPIVQERQAHATRAEMLRRMVAERERLPELLWPLQNASRLIDVDDFTLLRTAEGWEGSLRGTATSTSGSSAASAVQALYDEFSLQLPEGTVTLDDLRSTTPGDPQQIQNSVAVSFVMSFIVPLERWEGE